jgi:hypothetical protein
MPYADKIIRLNYQKDRRNKLREAGVCTRCAGPRDELEGMDCSNCRKKSNKLVKSIIKKNLKAGKCRCGKIRRLNKLVCKRCANHSKRILRELKFRVIAGYGGKCKCCGMKIWEFLSIDHIKERGADERKRLGGRSKLSSGSFYRKIIKENFPNYYQLLCYNCNMSLGFFGYCPHNPKIRRSINKT